MSNLAAEVVLHPKLSQLLSLLATTAGRDKIHYSPPPVYRLIQYLSRLIAWLLLRKGAVEDADRFTGLSGGFALSRRSMRVFRFAEFLQSAMNLAQRPITNLSGSGQVAHLAQIGKQVSFAGYYTFDSLSWLGSVRALKWDKTKVSRVQRLGAQFWFWGVSLSLLSTFASLAKLRKDGKRFALANQVARRDATNEKSLEDRARTEEERREKGRALLAQRQALLSALVTDSLDVWIPATAVGYINLNDGVVGALGAIASYMSIQTLWLKHAAAGMRKTA